MLMDGLIMLLIKLIVCNWKALPGVPFAGGLNRIIKSKKKNKSQSPEALARSCHKVRGSWEILLNKLQTLVISARGLSHRNRNLNWHHMPASIVRGFRSEAYIHTNKSFYLETSSQQDDFSGNPYMLHVRVSKVLNYCRKTKWSFPLPHYLFAYKRPILLREAKVMVQLRWGEWEQAVQSPVGAVSCTFPTAGAD